MITLKSHLTTSPKTKSHPKKRLHHLTQPLFLIADIAIENVTQIFWVGSNYLHI